LGAASHPFNLYSAFALFARFWHESKAIGVRSFFRCKRRQKTKSDNNSLRQFLHALDGSSLAIDKGVFKAKFGGAPTKKNRM
jgi:hypothetical protein